MKGRFAGRCVCLVGMPGSGKSTVGLALSARLSRPLVDLDARIEQAAGGRKLWQISADEGHDGLLRREAAAAVAVDEPDAVIATGGSVVYAAAAMDHLRSLGNVVYLHVPPQVLTARAGDLAARGVVIRPGMTLADLYAERDPLYRLYSHAVVEASDPVEAVTRAVAAACGLEPA